MGIQVLPRDVVDRIAAGEVVERPASVVKELVENALDASATRIDIDLTEGGRSLIRVVDDGTGIPREELALALASHATSKIRDSEELFHVVSLGFRGEALSSIAAVSRLCLRSRVPGSETAAEIVAEAGWPRGPAPASGPVGTCVEVRDLFFNTPVRRRFLKTPRSEVGRAADWVTRLALTRPDVAFHLRHDGRDVFHFPRAAGLRERITRAFGSEIGDRLLPVQGGHGSLQLEGFALPPGVSRANTRLILFFVNGRFVRDKTWLAAVREAYRGLLMRGRSPIAFLALTVDPGEVDVNVHPTKEEVRFREPSRLFSLTVQAIRAALGQTDLRPNLYATRVREGSLPSGMTFEQTTGPGAGQSAMDVANTPCSTARTSGVPAASDDSQAHLSEGRSAVELPAREAPGRTPPLEPGWGEEGTPAVQVLRTYLIQERPDGLAVTDQHALHERILFEEIKARLVRGRLPVQQLLVPEVVKLSPREAALIHDAAEELARFGLLVEGVGVDRVSIAGVPELLRRADPRDLLEGVLVLLQREEGRGPLEALTDNLVATLACRAAIKAGDVLDAAAIRALLEQGKAVDCSPFCPHGRPVTVYVAVSEIERWFGRKV